MESGTHGEVSCHMRAEDCTGFVTLTRDVSTVSSASQASDRHACVTWVILLCRLYIDTFSKSMGQPGKVANPTRGQLKRENEYFPVRVRT